MNPGRTTTSRARSPRARTLVLPLLASLALAACGAKSGLDAPGGEGGAGGEGGGGATAGTAGTGGATPTTTATPTPTPTQCLPLCGGGQCAVEVLAQNQPFIFAIALDDKNVYWVEGPLNPGSTNRVRRVSKTGGLVENLQGAAQRAFSVVAGGGLAYWSELGDPNDDSGLVYRYDLATKQVGLVASGLSAPGPLWLSGGDLYWTDLGDGTLKLAVGGKDPQPLDGFVGIEARDLVGDDSHLYVSSFDAVLRLPKSGGDVDILVGDLEDPRDIAIAGDDLYIADFKHAVVHATKDGGLAEILVEGSLGNAVAVDSLAVYYVTDEGLFRLCRDGSLPPELLTSAADSYSLAVDADGIYFASGAAIGKIPK